MSRLSANIVALKLFYDYDLTGGTVLGGKSDALISSSNLKSL